MEEWEAAIGKELSSSCLQSVVAHLPEDLRNLCSLHEAERQESLTSGQKTLRNSQPVVNYAYMCENYC